MDLSDLMRAPTHAQPVPRVDEQGQILSADALKMRGMHAAQYHKTSIDTMLHSRHAGATPYRTVLGNVSPPPPAPTHHFNCRTLDPRSCDLPTR